MLNKIISKHTKKLKSHSIDLVIRQIIREIINEMVSDVIVTTKKNIKICKIKNLSDIYKTKKKLVDFSERMQKFDEKIKAFLKNKMYFHKSVNSNTDYGKKVLIKLFLQIKKILKNI